MSLHQDARLYIAVKETQTEEDKKRRKKNSFGLLLRQVLKTTTTTNSFKAPFLELILLEHSTYSGPSLSLVLTNRKRK